MGQKINPTGLRIGVIKNWESRWYAGKSTFGDTLVEDYNLREYLLDTLAPAGVPKVEIERDAKRSWPPPWRPSRASMSAAPTSIPWPHGCGAGTTSTPSPMCGWPRRTATT